MPPNYDLGNYVDNDFPTNQDRENVRWTFRKERLTLRLGHSAGGYSLSRRVPASVWAHGLGLERSLGSIRDHGRPGQERLPGKNRQREESRGRHPESGNGQPLSTHLWATILCSHFTRYFQAQGGKENSSGPQGDCSSYEYLSKRTFLS